MKYSMLESRFRNLDSMVNAEDAVYKDYQIKPVTFELVELTKSFLKLLVDNNIPQPGVFPKIDEPCGGIFMEWSNHKKVISIELLNNKNYECFALEMSDTTYRIKGVIDSPSDFSDIFFFVMKHI